MAVSRAERLRRKREAEAKRRKKIFKDPDKLAELNKKRRIQYRKRKEAQKGKVESERTVKLRRRKWRLEKRRYLQKKKEQLTVQDEEKKKQGRAQSMIMAAKRRREQKRVSLYNRVRKLEDKTKSLRQLAAKYKQRWYRLKALQNESTSPKTTLRKVLRKSRTPPKVRRQLLFTTALLNDVSRSYKEIASVKDKKVFAMSIKFRYVKKYRFLNAAKPYFPFEFSVRNMKSTLGVRRKKMMFVRKVVTKYFEDDEVSSLSPEKKDYIVKKKIRKQKRYLNNTMKYLFRKFCRISDFVISYTSFCRLRPFWVCVKKVGNRETCMCIKHENINLMARKLKQLHIIDDGNVDRLIENWMYCEPITYDCRFRKCEFCQEKSILINEFDGEEDISYEMWQTKTEEKGGRVYRRTAKNKIFCKGRDLVDEFFECLPSYMAHVGLWYFQKETVTNVRSNLTDEDIFLHLDFSENYSCKYSTEIQAIHFGGNHTQITLHTGVKYNGSKTVSFCVVSPNLNHDAIAIFSHIKEIFGQSEEDFSNIKNVHFLSDSPSTQYRNKSMFYIIFDKIRPLFSNLSTLTWNYSEAGHGKGAPDGIRNY